MQILHEQTDTQSCIGRETLRQSVGLSSNTRTNPSVFHQQTREKLTTFHINTQPVTYTHLLTRTDQFFFIFTTLHQFRMQTHRFPFHFTVLVPERWHTQGERGQSPGSILLRIHHRHTRPAPHSPYQTRSCIELLRWVQCCSYVRFLSVCERIVCKSLLIFLPSLIPSLHPHFLLPFEYSAHNIAHLTQLPSSTSTSFPPPLSLPLFYLCSVLLRDLELPRPRMPPGQTGS